MGDNGYDKRQVGTPPGAKISYGNPYTGNRPRLTDTEVRARILAATADWNTTEKIQVACVTHVAKVRKLLREMCVLGLLVSRRVGQKTEASTLIVEYKRT